MARSSAGRVAQFRHVLLAGCASASLFSWALPAASVEEPRGGPDTEAAEQAYRFDIAPQGLNCALQEWAAVTGLDWGYVGPGFGDTRTKGVQGTYTGRAALERILAGTGFTYRITATGGYSIVRMQPALSGLEEMVESPGETGCV